MIVGLIAGVLTTACWVPQLVRSIRDRKVDSFSWWYLVTIATGIALWVSYGFIRSDLDIVLPNALTFGSVIALSVVKGLEEARLRRVAALETLPDAEAPEVPEGTHPGDLEGAIDLA